MFITAYRRTNAHRRSGARSCSSKYSRSLALILLLLALLLLAACGDKEDAQPEARPASGATGEQGGSAAQPGDSAQPAPVPTPFTPQGNLVLWHSWAGADADALTRILTRLKQEAPLLSVETLYVAPDDLPQAFADAVRAGGGPDVAVTENWWIGDLVAAGAARPLDDLAQAAQLQEYWPAALSDFQRDGSLFALPATYEVVGLFVNPALANANQIPVTADALLAQAQVSPTLGVGIYANLLHTWWGFPAYGSQLFDPTGKVILDRSSGAADFLAWMQAIAQTPGSFVDTDYGMLIDRFKKGEFAFFVDGPWATSELRGALGDGLAVVPLPAGPVAPARPWMSAEGVFLNPRLEGDQALLAYFLASRLTDAPAGSDFAAGGRLPANGRATLPDDPVLRGFAQQASGAIAAPSAREMEQVWGYGGDMLVKVLGGSMTPGEAVRETTALINDATGK